jgi:hypothetical protein
MRGTYEAVRRVNRSVGALLGTILEEAAARRRR